MHACARMREAGTACYGRDTVAPGLIPDVASGRLYVWGSGESGCLGRGDHATLVGRQITFDIPNDLVADRVSLAIAPNAYYARRVESFLCGMWQRPYVLLVL